MNDSTALQKYEGRANVLMPTQHFQQIAPWHAARIVEVRINPDPSRGEVYKVGSTYEDGQSVPQFALQRAALERIAQAAGIVWNWKDSHPEEVTRDYVRYVAVGAVRMPDGSWQPIVRRKEIDLEVIADELRDQYEARANQMAEKGGLSYDDAKRYKSRWEEVTVQGKKKNVAFLDASEVERYVEDKVRSNLIQWRKNKLMRAETGAMLRVIRAALGIKSHYTAEELEKPFVFPRIDFSPDYNDPGVRQMLLERGARGAQALFGGQVGGMQTVQQMPTILPPLNGPEDDAFDVPAGPVWDGDDDPPYADGDDHPKMGELNGDYDDDGPPLPDEPPPAEEWGGQEHPPAQGAPAQAAQQAPAQEGPTGCTDCGTVIESEKVVAYSRRTYGTELCYGCQQKRKAAGQ